MKTYKREAQSADLERRAHGDTGPHLLFPDQGQQNSASSIAKAINEQRSRSEVRSGSLPPFSDIKKNVDWPNKSCLHRKTMARGICTPGIQTSAALQERRSRFLNSAGK